MSANEKPPRLLHAGFKTRYPVFKTARAARLLPVLLLSALPGAMQAQDFTTTTNAGAITITGYTGPGGKVTIPDTIHGLPVTSIGNSAFDSQSTLTGVTIPGSVTNLGSWAFAYCGNLAEVTMDVGVVTLGYGAFDSCVKLAGVAIPDSITSIGTAAFNGCAGLTNVILGNGIASIGNLAFQSCASLAGIAIPDSVTNIGNSAFHACTALAWVTLGSGVTRIGDYAFSDCDSLASITIPDNVTQIAEGAFDSCSQLTHAAIGGGVGVIPNYCFSGCSSLASVTLGRSGAIGAGAFTFCGSLTRLMIPGSVTNIGASAFDACASLAGVFFGGDVPATGWEIFFRAPNVIVYYLPGTAGWGATLGGRPAVLWNPEARSGDATFGIRTNRFGFTITGTTGIPIVVEACADLAAPVWVPLQSGTLTNGSVAFSDADWTNFPARFYRIRSP